MKAISLGEIKQELQNLSAKQISELCLRMARYKKENKELLAYLLFSADDIDHYSAEIKESIDEAFKSINKLNLYLAKRILRKILRQIDKHIKFSLSRQLEAELRIHFCLTLKASGIAIHNNKALANMYEQQIKKTKTAITALHEDIQFDFMKELKRL